MEELEKLYIQDAEKLNLKREALLMNRIKKTVKQLVKAPAEDHEGILASLRMPNTKEWNKVNRRLLQSSVKMGILRGFQELGDLKDLYVPNFDSDEEYEVIDGMVYRIKNGRKYKTDVAVLLPEKALEWLEMHSISLSNITDDTTLRLVRHAIQRNLEGESYKTTMERLADALPEGFTNNRLETIARTESSRFYNAGRIAQYTEPDMEGFVTHLQYDAIDDDRNTDLCEGLNQKIVPITDKATIARLTPPNHFMCRSTWLPVTMYEDVSQFDMIDSATKPQKGFDSPLDVAPILPDKTKGEKLVQPKAKVTAKNITPELARTLGDDEFRDVIADVSDRKLKHKLVMERAEDMLRRETSLEYETVGDLWDMNRKLFKADRVSSGARTVFYEFAGNSYEIPITGYISSSVADNINLVLHNLANADATESMWNALKDHLSANTMANQETWLILAPLGKQIQDGTFQKNLMTSKIIKWNGLQKLNEKPSKNAYDIDFDKAVVINQLQERMDEAQNWYRDYMWDDYKPDKRMVLNYEPRKKRESANPKSSTLNLGDKTTTATIVHEIGHIVHTRNKNINDAVDFWWLERTKGEKMSKYNKENTKRDKFYSPYIGRVYGDEKSDIWNEFRDESKSNYGFEAFTMGVQEMYENPQRFFERDKDHFIFTYSLMRGLFGKRKG